MTAISTPVECLTIVRHNCIILRFVYERILLRFVYFVMNLHLTCCSTVIESILVPFVLICDHNNTHWRICYFCSPLTVQIWLNFCTNNKDAKFMLLFMLLSISTFPTVLYLELQIQNILHATSTMPLLRWFPDLHYWLDKISSAIKIVTMITMLSRTLIIWMRWTECQNEVVIHFI